MRGVFFYTSDCHTATKNVVFPLVSLLNYVHPYTLARVADILQATLKINGYRQPTTASLGFQMQQTGSFDIFLYFANPISIATNESPHFAVVPADSCHMFEYVNIYPCLTNIEEKRSIHLANNVKNAKIKGMFHD